MKHTNIVTNASNGRSKQRGYLTTVTFSDIK